jgi:hypothetical protein
MELRALTMLGEHSVTRPHPAPNRVLVEKHPQPHGHQLVDVRTSASWGESSFLPNTGHSHCPQSPMAGDHTHELRDLLWLKAGARVQAGSQRLNGMAREIPARPWRPAGLSRCPYSHGQFDPLPAQV